ncbi:MAG TPA: 5-formyltetrahydrofolate cyclo-ligase [Caulobacteraceae bacterium]|nr:5-formyltetrahydrofolate cyclo-ligase [Caulobacteraceae bacterium]
MTTDAADPSQSRARLREQLIACRQTLSPMARRAAEVRIVRALITHFGLANPGVVGCYWAHRGEPDIRDVMLRIIDLGGQVALPAPVRPRRAMDFRAWGPLTKVVPGLAGVPTPADGALLRPDVLLVPVVGFDARGHRLGYGGGYYDRTLAALSPRPKTIGVAFERARVNELKALPHDIPLDMIATEAGVRPALR